MDIRPWALEENSICFKGRSILFCVSVVCLLIACAADDGGTSVSSLAAEETEKNEADAKAATEARAKEREEKEAAKEAEKKKEKELAAAKALTRKEISNAQDKIQRAQANLSRNEQLLDSLKGRRDQTKQALSELLKSGGTTISISISGTTNGTKKSKAEIEGLIKQQEDEIIAIQDEIKKQTEDIAALEKLVDDLTKKI